MKKKILVLMTMMSLIFGCSAAITVRAEDAHQHKNTTYGEYAGHWTEQCKIHPNCTVAVTMYKLSYVCSCGHISYGEQREEQHSNAK